MHCRANRPQVATEKVANEGDIALSDLDAYVLDAYVLYRSLYRSDDGKLRGIDVPYVTMTGVEVNVAG